MRTQSDSQPLRRAAGVIALAAVACCAVLAAAGPARAAIAFRASGTGQNGTGNATLTITKPAGTAANDVMVATVYTASTSAPTTVPSGWNLISTTSPTVGKVYMYYKVADGSEGASFGWVWGSSVQSAGTIVGYTGVNTTNPIGANAVATAGSGTAANAPVVTTIAASSVVIVSAAWNRANTDSPAVTSPTTTARGTVLTPAGASPNKGVTTNDFTQAAAATTALKAFGSGTAVTWGMQTVALTPSGGTLSFTTAPNLPNLPALTLNGTAQTLTAAMNNFAVDDETGSKSGWNVTVNGDGAALKSPVFAQYCPVASCGGGHTGPAYFAGGAALAASSLTLSSTGASLTGGTGTAPALQCSSPCALDVPSGSPTKVVSAATTGGFATWTSTGFGAASVSLPAPTTVRALQTSEVYRSDLVWSLNSGP